MNRRSKLTSTQAEAPQSRRDTVARVEAYLRAHIETPPRVSTLSRLVGLSERALRDAFYTVHGMSPKQWMLGERLNRVRTILTASDSDSVTGAATTCGFYELGRFAATYREAFGEAPSETLRSAIRRAATTHPTLKGEAHASTR